MSYSPRTSGQLRAAMAAVLVACIAETGYAQVGESIEPVATDSWRFGAGAGVVSAPRYPGSDERRLHLLPLLSASYGRFFVGGLPGGGVPLGVGAFLLQDPHFKLGVGLGGGFGKARKESDDARLRGLGDISQTPRFSLFGSYGQDVLVARANVATDIGGHHEGTLASFELEGRLRLLDGLSVSAGPGLTWADSSYTQTFFGVNSQQSAASGRPVYNAGSGLNSVRLGFGGLYAMTPRWGIGARATLGRLLGDARNSPVTADRTQNTFGLFTDYRF